MLVESEQILEHNAGSQKENIKACRNLQESR